MTRPALRRLDFPGHSGARLAARLELPEGAPRGAALFAHCFTCGKDLAAARRIAAGLTARGFAVLRFDFTGLGHSEGEFASTGFASNVGDLGAAAEAMAAEGVPPTLLVGHSLGGAAVIAAAGAIPSVRAVATIGAPAAPGHVLAHLGASVEAIRAEGSAEVSLGGRAFTVGKGFVEEVAAARLEPALAGLRRALLILHAPRDEVVGIDEAGKLFAAAKHPKSFVSLDDADHLLSRPEDAAYAAEVIAAWASRYAAEGGVAEAEAPVAGVGGTGSGAGAPRGAGGGVGVGGEAVGVGVGGPGSGAGAPSGAGGGEVLAGVAEGVGAGGVAEGVVRSTEVDAGGFLQRVAMGAHGLLADEPVSVGGGGKGPTPYDLLSAALATCTAMTVRMYARRKGWPLEGVEAEVTHAKVHAEDCADCETREGKVDRFERILRLRGDLSEDQRVRLLEIADRCPVHRTLHSEVEVRTRAD